MDTKPTVYFCPPRSHSPQTGLVSDVLTVFGAAGFDQMIKPNDVVAIKLHCGEWNNTAYLRPVYARALADHIKELGGRPFVCDTLTQTYSPYASRSSALDMLITAERNGFTSATLGCPFIIADGVSGKDDVNVKLPEGFILQEAFVAAGIAHADVLIALSHFKGHPLGVIGGAIKNLGIGCQSRRGKHNVHMGGHPRYGLGAISGFHPENCRGRNGCEVWQLCQDCCPLGLIEVTEDSVIWHDRASCTNCLAHLSVNTWCGVFDSPSEHREASICAMADGCLAVVKAVGKDRVGFINMAIDVSPQCDCVAFADMPVVPNVGVFSSRDPVAIDAATKDAITSGPGMPGSLAEDLDVLAPGVRKMEVVTRADVLSISEDLQMNTGVRIGLGSSDYELVEIEPEETRASFFLPDRRPVGLRFGRKERGPLRVFPVERFEGRGFDRRDAVDFTEVR